MTYMDSVVFGLQRQVSPQVEGEDAEATGRTWPHW